MIFFLGNTKPPISSIFSRNEELTLILIEHIDWTHKEVHHNISHLQITFIRKCWVVPKLLEVSELKETNLSSRSSKSGSPGLRAPWTRCFFMELKTSGSSISSESSRSFESSDTTCSPLCN